MTDQTDKTATGNGAAASEGSGDGTAAPASTTASPGSELDAAIKEFEAGVGKSTANPDVPSIAKLVRGMRDEIKPLADYVAAEAQGKFRQKEEEAVKATISAVRKEAKLPDSYDDDLVYSLTNGIVMKDPVLLEAWQNRDKSPDGWNSQLPKISEKIAKWHKQLHGEQSSEPPRHDVERAAASVRNTSHEPPPKFEYLPNEKVFAMNDREFDIYAKSAAAATAAKRAGAKQ